MKNLFYNAEFSHEKDGNGPYAEFDKQYIVDVKNYSKVKNHDGKLSIFLESCLESYGKSINRDGKMYLNKFTVEFIMGQIRHFKKKGRWEIVE